MGNRIQFTSSLSPFVTATAYQWDFGDPDSREANTAAGQAPFHIYVSAGTYRVSLQVKATDGRTFSTSQQVVIYPIPLVSFPPDSVFCPGGSKLLSPGPQPVGSTFRWSDGSTGAVLVASSPGWYYVEVTTPQGCSSRGGILLREEDCPTPLPNNITPNHDGLNETFVLAGRNPRQWNIKVFSRWGKMLYQAASYDNSWDAPAQPAGLYYYVLTNGTTGQRLKGWVEVVR